MKKPHALPTVATANKIETEKYGDRHIVDMFFCREEQFFECEVNNLAKKKIHPLTGRFYAVTVMSLHILHFINHRFKI